MNDRVPEEGSDLVVVVGSGEGVGDAGEEQRWRRDSLDAVTGRIGLAVLDLLSDFAFLFTLIISMNPYVGFGSH